MALQQMFAAANASDYQVGRTNQSRAAGITSRKILKTTSGLLRI